MLVLGGIISLVPLFETARRTEKEAIWIPVGVAAVLFIPAVHYLAAAVRIAVALVGRSWPAIGSS